MPQREREKSPLAAYLGYSAGAAGILAFIAALILATKKRVNVIGEYNYYFGGKVYSVKNWGWAGKRRWIGVCCGWSSPK